MSYSTHHSIPSRPPLSNSSRCDGWHGRWLSYLLLLVCCFVTTSVMANSYTTTIKSSDFDKNKYYGELSSGYFSLKCSDGASSIHVSSAVKASNRIFEIPAGKELVLKSSNGRKIREVVFEDTEGESDYKNDPKKRLGTITTESDPGTYTYEYKKSSGSQENEDNIRGYSFDAPSTVIKFSGVSGKQFKFRRLTVVLVDEPRLSFSDFSNQKVDNTINFTDIVADNRALTDQTINWSSSDASAVKISDGKIKFLKVGDYTITASAVANNNYAIGSVSQTVHVSKNDITPALSASWVSMKVWEAKDAPVNAGSIPSDYDTGLITYQSTGFSGKGLKVYYKDKTQLNTDFSVKMTFPETPKYNGATLTFTMRATNTITTKDDWDSFANSVNNGVGLNSNVVMTQDITLSNTSPMVGVDSHRYSGTFEGGSHTLTVDYNGTEAGAAPFHVVQGAVIKNLRTAGNISQNAGSDWAEYYVSGLVGFAYGVTIDNCEVDVSVMFSRRDEKFFGGFVGNANDMAANITNCKFNGSVASGSHRLPLFGIAGFVGWGGKLANISNCYVSGKYSSVIILNPLIYKHPENVVSGTFANNYYNSNCVNDFGRSVDDSRNADYSGGKYTIASAEQVKSGEVTWNLQGSGSVQYWGQTAGDENGPQLRSFNSNAPRMYRVAFSVQNNIRLARYANQNQTVSWPQVTDLLLSGYNDTHYFSIATSGNFTPTSKVTADVVVPVTLTEKAYCEIASLDNWKTFNAYTKTFPKVAAKLTADVSGITAEDVVENYRGAFDGGSHKLTVNISSQGNYISLFRVTLGATFSDLTVTGTIVNNSTTEGKYAGGFIGNVQSGDATRLTRCVSNVTISTKSSGDNTNGGFIGVAEGPVIVNDCAFIGKMVADNGANSCAGFIGWAGGKAQISNSLVNADFQFADLSQCYTFSRNPGNVTISNCYYATAFGSVNSGAKQLSVDQLQNGSAAWLLQANRNDLSWGQTIDGTQTALPTTDSKKRVWQVLFNKGYSLFKDAYINDGKVLSVPSISEIGVSNPHYYYTLTTSGWNVQAPVTQNVTIQLSLSEAAYLPIANKSDWKTFCDYIKNVSASVDAQLTGDVALDASSPMAGDDAHRYGGIFDGRGKTLTLAYTGTSQCTAPFMAVEKATIKNLKTAGTVSQTGADRRKIAQFHASGLIGAAHGVTIDNCEVAAAISFTNTGDQHSGGFIGHAQGDTVVMKNCKFSGKFIGTGGNISGIAGLIGWSAKQVTITNCYVGGAYENVSEIHPLVYTATDDNPTVDGSSNYYCVSPASASVNSFGSATRLSQVEVAHGLAAYYLQNGQTAKYWGQSLGTDSEPQLSASAPSVHKVDFVYKDKVITSLFASDRQPVYGNASELQGGVTEGKNKHHYYYVSMPDDYDAATPIMKDTSVVAAVKEMDYMPIASASDWDSFCTLINEGRNFLDAKLTDNVNLDQNAMKAGEKLNYSGVFDGQGKTLTVAYVGTGQGTAPFYSVDNAIIRNLKTAGTIQQTGTSGSNPQSHASGMVGIAHGVTFENCESAVAITYTLKGDHHSGGFVGHAQGGTVVMTNCKFSGSFSGIDVKIWGVAGLVGWSAKTSVINNCYVGGTYNSSVYDFHPLIYTSKGDNPVSQGTNNFYCVSPRISTYDNVGNAEQLGSDKVNLGVAIYGLQQGVGANAWSQKLGSESEPMLFQKNIYPIRRVAFIYNDKLYDARYAIKGQAIYGSMPSFKAEDLLGSTYNAHHFYQTSMSNGFVASQIVDNDLDVNVSLIDHEYYPVKSADDLAAFASIVKGGNKTMDAGIEQNIDFTDYSKAHAWDPINNYAGIFDGHGHTITNFNKGRNDGDCEALFGSVAKDGMVQNLTFGAGSSVFMQHHHLGMFVNDNYGTIRRCIAQDCSNQSGKYDNQGMIAGFNHSGGMIEDCAVIRGQINNRYSSNWFALSGIVGTNENGATVKNSIVYDLTISAADATSGSSYICANNSGTIENCFTNKKFGGNEKDTPYLMSNDDFKSGKVLSQIGAAWAQQLGKDDIPTYYQESRVGEDNYVYNEDGEWKTRNFVLTDGKYLPLGLDLRAEKATLKREMNTSQVYTSALPFEWTADNADKVYTLSRVNEDKSILYFKEVEGNKLEAHKPYLILPGSNVTEISATDAAVTAAPSQPETVDGNGVQFIACYAGMDNATAAAANAYILQDDKLWHPVKTEKTGGYITPYHAYIVFQSTLKAKNYAMAFGDGSATGIHGIMTEDADGTVRYYNLSGRYVGTSLDNLPQGVYICNGKKIVKK